MEPNMEREKVSWFWLSFCGDDGFRGGCLIEGESFIEAVARSHALGINPGGEVQGAGPIPDDNRDKSFPTNRLLQKHEIPGAMKWNQE